MKKVLALLLVIVMLSSMMAGCGANNAAGTTTSQTPAASGTTEDPKASPSADAAQDVKADPSEYDPSKYDGLLAWYYPFPHPFGEACKAGAEAYVADTGVNVNIVIGPEFTMASELESIETLVAQGYKYFGVFSVDASAADGMYEELTAKGNVFNNVGWGTTDKTVAYHLISTNIYQSAWKSMEYVGEKLGYKGGIMLAYETLTDAAVQERKAAVEDFLNEHPEMYLAAEAFDVTTVAEASVKIENTLNANIGKVDAIVSLGFTCTQALVTTLGDYYDRGGEKIICVGIDTDDLIFEGLRKGILNATVAQNSWGIGYLSCEIMRLQAEGWVPKKDGYHVDTGIVMVTNENIDTYNKDLEKVTKDIMESLTTVYMEKK